MGARDAIADTRRGNCRRLRWLRQNCFRKLFVFSLPGFV
jgi:hypothetical protein